MKEDPANHNADQSGQTENANPSGLLRSLWRLIPLSPMARGRLAARAFASAPWAFGWSRAYRAWRLEEARRRQRAEDAKAIAYNAADDGLAGYAPLTASRPPQDLQARVIAFYLPQFHPIPENDEWWGEGFTEWANVLPAEPLFKGHYQPHRPSDLGTFDLGAYDLLADPGIQERQSTLAVLHGLSGFCFYFYWFGGKRLLEAPIENYAANANATLPFCLCWANENWSRRWDGRDDDILMAQDHSPEDDIAFIAHLQQYLANPKYLRIGDRPLIIVYRPALLPNARATAERWRAWCRTHGVGEIYLAYTQSFEADEPDVYGFDAAIEFPPNNMGLVAQNDLALDLAAGFTGQIYDWRKLAERSDEYPAPAYRLFRGVTPSWDNTARRGTDAGILVGATPQRFRAWLANAIADTIARFDEPSERLIFVNAWNEWAEGAHLEPDERHGYAWLEAVRRAVSPSAADERPRLIIVVHDLFRYGAQFLALNLATVLKNRLGFDVATVAAEGGPLAPSFEALGPLHVLNPNEKSAAEIQNTLSALRADGFEGAIFNSAATGGLASAFSQAGISFIALVHEMSGVIERMGLQSALQDFDQKAEEVIFPASIVARSAGAAAQIPHWRNQSILPQGLYKNDDLIAVENKMAIRRRVTNDLSLPDDAFIILGVGYGDHRKGVDIFLDWAVATTTQFPNAVFIWVGALDPAMQSAADQRLDAVLALRERVRFVGFVDDTGPYYAAAHLFALTSREDPFPSTALEALGAGTPVVMVAGASGIEELAPFHVMTVLKDAAPDGFVKHVADVMAPPGQLIDVTKASSTLITERFGFVNYAADLARRISPAAAQRPKISVVVPNYNYEKFLARRLTSIVEQTMAPCEIIFIDDASTDDSVRRAGDILRQSGVNHRIVVNAKNSGSVFDQWRNAITSATGEILWIAEADDVADPRLLSVAARAFHDPSVVLSVVGSQQIDADGAVIAESYQNDLSDISPDQWRADYIHDGLVEIAGAFAVKNSIPNVSGVLFRRAALSKVFEAHFDQIRSYRVAGDWCVYVNLLRHGRIAYTAAGLNSHRRHASGVTDQRFGLSELAEIARMQAFVATQVKIAPEMQKKADAYIDHLIAVFDLKSTTPPAALAAALRAARHAGASDGADGYAG